MIIKFYMSKIQLLNFVRGTIFMDDMLTVFSGYDL